MLSGVRTCWRSRFANLNNERSRRFGCAQIRHEARLHQARGFWLALREKKESTMFVRDGVSRRQQILLGMIVVLFAALPGIAQMAPTRTIEELKVETQRRVDKN